MAANSISSTVPALTVTIAMCYWVSGSSEVHTVPDGGAEVGLGTTTEFAVPTLRDVEWDDVVSRGNRRDPFPHTLHHAPSLVTQYTGEESLGIPAPQGMSISVTDPCGQNLQKINNSNILCKHSRHKPGTT